MPSWWISPRPNLAVHRTCSLALRIVSGLAEKRRCDVLHMDGYLFRPCMFVSLKMIHFYRLFRSCGFLHRRRVVNDIVKSLNFSLDMKFQNFISFLGSCGKCLHFFYETWKAYFTFRELRIGLLFFLRKTWSRTPQSPPGGTTPIWKDRGCSGYNQGFWSHLGVHDQTLLLFAVNYGIF